MKKKIEKTKIKIKDELNHEHEKKIEEYSDLIGEDFLEYIKQQQQHDIWTECQNRAFIKRFKKKEYIYPRSNSNIQVSTFIKNIKKRKQDLFYLNRFYILLTNFVSNEYASKIIQKLYQNPDITDREFIHFFENLSKEQKQIGKYNVNNNTDRCSERQFEFENLYLKFKKLYTKIFDTPFNATSMKNSHFRYLDIGCGNGNKTKKIRDIFHIPKSMVYGTDIKNWGPYSSTKKFDFTFQYILENGKLDFPDNYFTFITCFMTLHHVPHLSFMIQEIKRILIPNGILLIVEHSERSMYDGLLVDIQHMLYSYLFDSKINPKEYKNYISNPTLNRYLNEIEWDYILSKYNFEFKLANILYSSAEYNAPYDNQFYGFYQNIKDS